MPFTAPGDELHVKILKTHKNYSDGECAELVKPSSIRVKPLCPVFEKCGGCSYQHLPYSFQFETKKKGLLYALKRAEIETGDLPIDDLPAKSEYHYRNRIQVRSNPKEKAIGFYARGGKHIVPISACAIARDEINQALPALAEEGFKKFPEEFKLEIEISPEGTIRHAFNRSHAAFGFRQVNDEQNEQLRQWIKKHVVSADLLLDLYGGSGNLSTPLLDRFSEIRCVDISTPKSTIAPHFFYERKDLIQWARVDETRETYQKSTSLILDPPREGLGPNFSEIEDKISRYAIQSMILVGCDVDSFVRDTKRFQKRGFRLARLGVLDLFPQTPHVESLALFFK